MGTVTISASYGAGGSEVARAVAHELGVEFIDRAIPAAVAEELGATLEEALERDEQLQPGAGSSLARLLTAMSFIAAAPPLPEEAFTEDAFKVETEKLIRHYADGPGAVILGRAAAFVLGDRPDVLHVRLDGPKEARLRQAMAHERLDESEARRLLEATDRARLGYLRHFYGMRGYDPSRYHLVIDSTAIPPKTCAAVIVEAAEARFRRR